MMLSNGLGTRSEAPNARNDRVKVIVSEHCSGRQLRGSDRQTASLVNLRNDHGGRRLGHGRLSGRVVLGAEAVADLDATW